VSLASLFQPSTQQSVAWIGDSVHHVVLDAAATPAADPTRVPSPPPSADPASRRLASPVVDENAGYAAVIPHLVGSPRARLSSRRATGPLPSTVPSAAR
jgi:hypothetical protein